MITDKEIDPSDSSVQHRIEQSFLARAQKIHPEWQETNWDKASIDLKLSPVWKRAKPDGVWIDPNGNYIIAECYIHIGKLKSGQLRKLAIDAFKLSSIKKANKSSLIIECKIILPEELFQRIGQTGWLFEAIHQETEILPIPLSETERQELIEAINRQAGGQSRMVKRLIK